MALSKTYFLVPNFDFRPGGRIALGNIIADPFEPHRILTTPNPNGPQLAIETTTQEDFHIVHDAGGSLNMSIWAQFLETVGANASSDYSKHTVSEYSMSALKTTQFTSEPTEDEILLRINEPKVRRTMRPDSTRSHPVYMIVGIKIAENLSVNTGKDTTKGGSIGGSVPIAEGISTGANIALSRQHGHQESFRAGNDVVFAYQLLEIGLKGWREKRLEMKEFQHKAAFLGDETEEEESTVEVEIGTATADSLEAQDQEGVELKKAEFTVGGESCVCISFKEL